MKKQMGWIGLVVLALAVSSCATQNTQEPSPTATILEENAVRWPRDQMTFAQNGVPTVAVYVTSTKTVETLGFETYLEGVLAGEMKNDWPMEALKAQAILARTYALKFIGEKDSRYQGAEISTDIEEAQAYDASAVNDRIRQAVAETRGMVLSCEGELPYAWFHAHSGGMTEMAKTGLGWEKDEPAYTRVTQGNEPQSAEDSTLAEAAEWKATFTPQEFAKAAAAQGKSIDLTASTQLTIGERGQSGRALTILCGDQTLDAPTLRIALGSTKMRSTLLTSLKVENGQVVMAGKGYGHGVGMSQWGAYGMAEEGKTAEQIVTHYFQNVKIAKLW